MKRLQVTRLDCVELAKVTWETTRYLYRKKMRTDQEAMRTKEERKYSYDGIGKARLYAWLR